MITCRVLGVPEVAVDGAAAPPELLWSKNFALLVYLARSPKRTRTREHLIGLLWADKPQGKAKHSLNEALRRIRRAAGPNGVRTRAAQVALDADAIQLDTDRFEELTRVSDFGEFLEGFAVPGASEFDNWLAAERSAWRRRSVDALVRFAERALGAGDLRGALEFAEHALTLEPVSDAAIQGLMRSRAIAGDRAGALEAYDQFARRLAADVGAKPHAETATLAERVRRGRVWRTPQAAAVDSAADSRRAPLVSRSLDLGRLLKVWRECRAERHAAVLFIEGDAGAGKSRLADELAARARLDGASVSGVRAVEGDLREPESALLGLARGGLLDAPGLAAAPTAALAVFAARDTGWAERFPAARSSGAPLALGPAFSDLLRAVTAERPVVLVVDDAYWVDRESLLVLGAVARDLARAPVCLVFTTTPGPLRPELEELRKRLRRDLLGVTVRLKPLVGVGLRELARWALPHYTATDLDRVCRRVAADSAGIPLLAVELLHAVALGLDLKTPHPTWPAPTRTLQDSLPGDLPDSVVGAVRVGFRHLSKNAQQVLAAAAVLGERVAAEVLGRATGIAGADLTAALDELEWQSWLSFDPRGYSFVARIVQRVVDRDMVLQGQRDRILAAAT